MLARGGSQVLKVPKAMVERKDDTSGDQPFLSRWSERKRASDGDSARASPDTDPERVEGADTAADEELAANREAAEAIDIDSLNKDSDYTPYFKDGVPPALKSAALQKLWRSSPIFANIDGLNDYDEDFTLPKTPIGAIKTAWKFGRGFLTDEDDADKGEAAPDPQTVGSGEDEGETVADAATSGPDAENNDDREGEPDPDSPETGPAETGQEDTKVSDTDVAGSEAAETGAAKTGAAETGPAETGPAETGSPTANRADAPGEKPDLVPAPGVGLRERLDMAAFSGGDED